MGPLKKISYNVNSELVDILKVVITSIDDAQMKEIHSGCTNNINLRHSNSNIGAFWDEMLNSEITANQKSEYYEVWTFRSIDRSSQKPCKEQERVYLTYF